MHYLVLQKTSNNVIEGTVGELKKSGADTLIKLTDNKDNSGLYTITHAADTTLQIGATESVTEYRYRGASPKNYVTFNNEVWRIIGIFPTDDGAGKIENRIKLIRNESIGAYYWNSNKISNTSSYNNWAGSTSTLNLELNKTYYNNLISEAKNMIEKAKYYLGGYGSNNHTPVEFYSYERKIQNTTENEFYYGTNPNSWVGNIAIMYVSDYGYAASDECTVNLYNYDNATCINNNWLFKGNAEWMLPQVASSSLIAFGVHSEGYVSYDRVSINPLGVRPVLYLISSVQITGGDGTSTNPYTFGL